MYDLIDERLKSYYITGHKCMFFSGLCLSLIFVALSVFYTVAVVFFVIFAIITLTFYITWNKNKKKYEKKLSYTENTITIYDHKNLIINEFKLDSLEKKQIKVAFDEYPKFNYINCLVMYIDFEPYENMEYSSFWNNSNVVIIQNSELIDKILKIISNH